MSTRRHFCTGALAAAGACLTRPLVSAAEPDAPDPTEAIMAMLPDLSYLDVRAVMFAACALTITLGEADLSWETTTTEAAQAGLIPDPYAYVAHWLRDMPEADVARWVQSMRAGRSTA